MKHILLSTLIIIAHLTNAQTVNLDYPGDGDNTWNGVQLDWYAASGINYGTDIYHVQVSTYSDFTVIFDEDSITSINSSSINSDTEFFISDLRFGQTYYWRVRVVIDGTTPQNWSEVSSFTTRDYVSLDYPDDEAFTWTGTTIDWYAHDYVDKYQWQVDTVNEFNSAAFLSGENIYINTYDGNSDTEESLADLYFGETYYWRVRAINAVDTSEWSVVRSFNTRDYVSLDYPDDEAFTWTGTTIDWYAHDYVDKYQWQVDTVNEFNSAAFLSGENIYINTYDGNSDTEESLADLYFGKTYYWRVRAINAVDTSEWSVVRSFNTRDYVSLDYPDDEAFTWTGTTIDWYAHDYVDKYEWQVDTVNEFNSAAFLSGEDIYINTYDGNSDTEEALADLYFGKTYYWRVRAINAVDTSEWSVVRTFITRDYVNLNYPSDMQLNVSTSGVNLDWYAHYGISYYDLQLDITNQFNSTALIETESEYINTYSENSDTEYATGTLQENTWYCWRVRARNANDTSAWTMRWFNTGNEALLLPQTPLLSAPANNSSYHFVDLSLEWLAAENATSYIVVLANNPEFNSPIISEETSSLNFEAIGLDDQTTYYWKIQSSDGTNYSDWSTVWAFQTGLQQVILSSPSDGAEDIPYLITDLEWMSVENATEYEVAMSTDESFTTIQFNDTVYSTTAHPYYAMNTEYFWKVRAINDFQTGEWSEIWSFTTDSEVSSEIITKNSIQVYPNPASNSIVCQFQNHTTDQFSIKIFDMNGKILLERVAYNGSDAIDISQLSSGFYVIQCTSKTKIYQTQFIKQ